MRKGVVYIDDDAIGEVDFEIVDQSMGAIGGYLKANSNYLKYQPLIQKHFKEAGISNVSHFNYRILLNNAIELEAEGGIGITDSEVFEEIYVESAGINLSVFEE